MTTTAPLLPERAEPEPTPPTRSASGRQHLRSWRGAWLVAALLAVVALVALLVGRPSSGGVMDPVSYSPEGGHALAALLRQRGVTVTRVGTASAALSAAGGPTTVVVSQPENDPDSLGALRGLPGGDDLVLVAPTEASAYAVQPGLREVGELGTGAREVDCTLPEARLAGEVHAGGLSYDDADAVGTPQRCYAGLVLVQQRDGGGRLVDVGSAGALSNGDLATDGNAALGLGLLGRNPRVVWLVPQAPAAGSADGTTPLTRLLPGRLGWAALQGIVLVLLLFGWRARRLGRVVPEPLPVVVRASETVEGQGRLYRAARARDSAAAALRRATVHRLAGPLGVRAQDADAVVAAAAARTGRPASAVGALLYGPDPEDDRALVALAAALDALEGEVRRS